MLDQAEIDAAIAAAAAAAPSEELSAPDETDAEEPTPAPAAPAPTVAAPTLPTPTMWASLDEPDLPDGPPPNLEIVMDIPLEVSVELGRKRMSIRDILDLGAGSIVELDKIAGEPVDLLVNGRLVARGEVVVIEDNFGVRVTEIIGSTARAAQAGAAPE